MTGATLVDPLQQSRILNCLAVKWGYVSILRRQLDSLPHQPGAISARGGLAGHDPEAAARLVKVGLLEQRRKIFQAGNAADGIALEPVPDHDHKRAIRNHQVGTLERLTIRRIMR